MTSSPGVYTYSFFKIRVAEELSRANRHRLPMTLLLINLLDFDQMSPESQEDLLSIIGLVFNHSIRDVDIPCRYSSRSSFALILPISEAASARVLIDKLGTSIESYGFKPFPDDRELRLHMVSHSFTPEAGSKPVFRMERARIDQFLAEADRLLHEP
jgi:GGDEF domain-containing protein